MNDFKRQLIEEFGQGIVDHISRNKGKYAIGAGVGALAGYGAYNGNLGSAVNAGLMQGGVLTGLAASDLPNRHIEYGEAIPGMYNVAKEVYTAEEDPEIGFNPAMGYSAGKATGNVLNVFTPMLDKVQEFRNSEEITPLSESEEIVSIDDDDDDDAELGKAAAMTIGGSAAVLAGVANADKIGRVIKNTGDHIASTAKGAGENSTRNIARMLLNTSIKLKESKDQNDNNIKDRNTKAAAEKK